MEFECRTNTLKLYIVQPPFFRRVSPSSLETSWHVFTWPFRNAVWLSLGITSVVFCVTFAAWRLKAHSLRGMYRVLWFYSDSAVVRVIIGYSESSLLPKKDLILKY